MALAEYFLPLTCLLKFIAISTRVWPERVGTLPASAAEAPLDPTFGTNKFRHLKRVG